MCAKSSPLTAPPHPAISPAVLPCQARRIARVTECGAPPQTANTPSAFRASGVWGQIRCRRPLLIPDTPAQRCLLSANGKLPSCEAAKPRKMRSGLNSAAEALPHARSRKGRKNISFRVLRSFACDKSAVKIRPELRTPPQHSCFQTSGHVTSPQCPAHLCARLRASPSFVCCRSPSICR